MARRARTHEVKIKLHFDKPVTIGAARRAARDQLHGFEFYADFYVEQSEGWCEGRVKVRKPR